MKEIVGIRCSTLTIYLRVVYRKIYRNDAFTCFALATASVSNKKKKLYFYAISSFYS